MNLDESRLEALLRLNQMSEASFQELTDFALEEAVRLTESKIGYLAFMNADETELTMHAWSKTAMAECRIIDKPIVYQVEKTGLWGEAVRQRKPVITNDYAAPNPAKKGYPDGHVHVKRHMNVPVFDGSRIALVAGVGNKDEPYAEADVRQLTLLMQGMWQIIQRRRAGEELRHARDELEVRVRERTAELAGANEELKQERYLLHTLMDYLPHNIYFKDTESRFLRINKALARYFGLEHPSEALGKTDVDFFTAEHAVQALADEQEIVRTGRPILDKEEKETWPDGRVTWASTTKMPLFDDSGRIVGTFGISRDITAQKQAAEALRAAKEAAEAASRAKSTFLANMSHEIRTPLNAIIGMAELVLDTPLSPRQREFLATVKDSGEALLAVINDILDFSRIEAGRLVLDKTSFDLREVLGDTMKSLALRAHKQGLELACHIAPDVPGFVVGDPSRIRQIVVNLVGNAIKFTELGEVVLDVGLESREDGHVVLHFAVRDTGIGIAEEKHAAIFDPFEQVDGTLTRRHGGSGLGLAISSRLAEQMGGRMWVESRLGQGSTFHFAARFELPEGEAGPVRCADPASIHGLRVLAVDDNATNRHILKEMLASWGMLPTTASGAREALQQMREARRAGTPFQLVLSDSHMPEMDGFTLAEQIGQDPEISSAIIVMLTSGDRPEDVARCEQRGVAAYLLKPVKQSELFDAIILALGIPAGEEEPAAVAMDHGPRVLGPLQILLAEDSLVNQKLAVALLERHGHSVVVANNGREAIAALESRAFDLVLMDVQMPEMDGLEATAMIRARQKQSGAHIPVVAMTAHALKGDRERCLEAGMDDYISKPIRATELFETLERVLTTVNRPPRDVGKPSETRMAVDWQRAVEAMAGDEALLRIVAKTALDEIPRLMVAIREAIAQGNSVALRLAAHTLEGAVRYFGPTPVFEQARLLENIGMEGRVDDAPAVLTILEGETGRLVSALAPYASDAETPSGP